MLLRVTGQITIDAPATKVWAILAHDFGHIGRWASAIPESQAVTNLPPPEGAEVGGRVCSAALPGVHAVREEITHYDEHAMRFGYTATAGLPSFVERAENTWTARALGPSETVVDARGELDVRLFPGLLLAPLLQRQLGRTAARVLEELKYYAEHDRPHPRKVQAQQQRRRKAATHA